jgi:hypothetical protein
VSLNSFTEAWGGAANLNVMGQGQWVFAPSPAVELGTQLRHGDGLISRPYVRVGATFLGGETYSAYSQFAAGAFFAPPFATRAHLDDVFGDVSAGVDQLGSKGQSLRFSYSERFSQSFRERMGSVKASWNF